MCGTGRPQEPWSNPGPEINDHPVQNPAYCLPCNISRNNYKIMHGITLSLLREIGQKLKEAIPPLRLSENAADVLGKGAAGDKTFEVDKVAEGIIIEELKKRRIQATVVSEELGEVDIYGGGHRIVIDPIDGSKNAVTGIPLFCSSIAVTSDDTVDGLYLSYILNYISGDEYWAEKGHGAYLNGKQLRTQQSSDIMVVLYETQVPGRDLKRILPVLSLANRTRCLGATAIDLALVASGAASLYINPSPTRSFDYAGGLLLLKEAGGCYTDIEGNDYGKIRLTMKKTPPILASSNIEVHKKALRSLSKNAGQTT